MLVASHAAAGGVATVLHHGGVLGMLQQLCCSYSARLYK